MTSRDIITVTEEPDKIIPDNINGTPVWKLEGVRLTNRELILRSDAWIHFSDHGDDGWGLMGSEAQINSWREDLAAHGITIAPWETLPYKPYGKSFALTVFPIILICFALGLFINPGLIILFVFGIISTIIIGIHNQYTCRHIRFASGLKAIFAWTILKDTHVFPGSNGHKS